MAAFFAPKHSKAKATPGAGEAPAARGTTGAAREEVTTQQGLAPPEENPEELLCSRCRSPDIFYWVIRSGMTTDDSHPLIQAANG